MADSSEIDSTLLTTDHSTTFSVTLDSSQSQASSKILDVTRDELERRQFVHTIQLLKLELSQKQLMLETVRGEQASQVEDLSEKLSDALHEKKLATLRLQSMTHAYEQEMKTLGDRNKELKIEVENKTQLTVEPPVQVMSSSLRQDVEQVLVSPHITESEYQRLASVAMMDHTIQDLIRLRVFELTDRVEKKCANLEQTVADLNQQLATRQHDLEECHQRESSSRECVTVLEEECSVLRRDLLQVKVQVQEGNYKIDNYSTVKRERDDLRGEVNRLRDRLDKLEARDKMTKEELDKLTMELSHSQQAEQLLRQDKEYVSRQLTDLTLRASQSEERASSLAMELTQAKRDREGVCEQLMKSREDQRAEYEGRLQRELESLRARTSLEMNQMRAQLTEVSDRECRTLSEARDIAHSERDGAVARERETSGKYEQLLKEHHELQASSERRVCELQAKLQVSQFERERGAMITEETTKHLSQGQLEKEKLQKKVDLLSRELLHCQTEKESEVKGLEMRVEEQRLRLEGYERVERDMDDIVMQAAQTEHECDAERVLFSYGFGTSLPTTSKRRLQQSVHLARRVLQLEKMNTSLKMDLQTKEDKVTNLRDEVSGLENLLEQSKQPYSYLIETIREKDHQLEGCKEELVRVRKEVEGLKSERERMVSVKNQMAADLEKLLSHREEMQQMKQLLFNMGPRSAPVRNVQRNAESAPVSDDNPSPTLFTKPGKQTRVKKRS